MFAVEILAGYRDPEIVGLQQATIEGLYLMPGDADVPSSLPLNYAATARE